MRDTHSQQSHQELAVELLAHQSQVPIEEVTLLYASELFRLGVGARIPGFLPVLAIRNVRELLHSRRADMLIAV